jgi:hypothetical protein
MYGEFGLSARDVQILKNLIAAFNATGGIRGGGGRPFLLLAKATEDIAKGESGDVQLYYRADDKGGETPAAENLTAYARLGDVTSGSWCYVWPILGSGLEVVAAECEVG